MIPNYYKSHRNIAKRAPGMSRMGRLRSGSYAGQRSINNPQPRGYITAAFGRWLHRAQQMLTPGGRRRVAGGSSRLTGTQGSAFYGRPAIADKIMQKRRSLMTAMTASTYMPMAALFLVVAGAINWALVGLFEFDLVAYLFGPYTPLSRSIYTLVGIAGLYLGYSYDRFTR